MPYPFIETAALFPFILSVFTLSITILPFCIFCFITPSYCPLGDVIFLCEVRLPHCHSVKCRFAFLMKNLPPYGEYFS